MTTDNDPTNPALNRLQGRALVVGVVCAIAVVAGGMSDSARFINAYLFAYLFILGISLGSLAIVMMHHLTGGDWGYLIRRICESAAMSMPLLTILFIPIAMGTKHLYPWANPDMVNGDRVLMHQAGYMGWWTIRACIYFAVWNILAFAMWHGSSKYDRTGNPWTVVRLQNTCAIGLFIYVITMSFATVDWIMLREVHWYSSILGLVICVSQVLGAVVLSISVLRVLRLSPSIGNYLTAPRLNDLGNLFLTFTILWAYMSFAQFLIIWMANINIETPWYVRRGLGGVASTRSYWQYIAGLLLVVHFFIPFFVLLGRNNKRRIERLSLLAMMILCMRALDMFWWAGPTSMNLPSIQTDLNGLLIRKITWVDILMPPALFGIWLTYVLWLLKRRPFLARREHGPEGAVENGGAHNARSAA